MLKWCLLLSLLTQRSLISSEPEVNDKTENTRQTRQLDFGNCCPCPGQDEFQDQNSANSNVESNRRSNDLDLISATGDDSCPCRSTLDSEGSSSIIRPAFRNVEPFIRPVSKKEPKPLLNPEVGLASSVLETLREVTDKKYQEALMRDAARDALQFMDPEQPEAEPRNEINILSLKEENNGDTISEATEIQPSTCILPPVNNNFEHLRLEPPQNLVKHILTSPKLVSNGILNTNSFGMDGSASDTQERMEWPLKSKILENMKAGLNLLNLKPFPNTDSRDLLNSPNILQKNSLRNNIRDHNILSRNRQPLLDVQSKSSNNLKELSTKNVNDKEKYMEPNEVSDFKQDSSVSFDNSATKLKAFAENKILQTTECTETVREPNISFEETSQDIDVVPSSSKVFEVKRQDIEDIPIAIIQESDTNTDMNTDTNNYIPNTFETVTEQNELPNSIEAVSEMITEYSKTEDVQNNDPKTAYVTENSENLNDMESEVVSNLRDATNVESISSTEDESKITYSTPPKVLRDQISLSATSAHKDTVGKNIHSLPNIKADIYRTLENFKKANEIIQKKLRSNVHDALRFVSTNEPQHTPPQRDSEPKSGIRTSFVEQPQYYVKNITNTSEDKVISTQDLQKMSDSLLELSSLKNKVETSTTSDKEREIIEGLENKTAEIEKVSDINDMITSPTSINEKNNMINLQNQKSNLNANDQKNDEIVENSCSNNIIPKTSDSSIEPNENHEMTAQPSNTVLLSISEQDLNPSKLGLFQRDYIVEPEDNTAPIEGIKHFFNRYRTLSAENSRNDDSDSVFFDNQPLFGYKNNKNIDSSKSFSRGNSPKLSSNSNISSYKAKVASPKSLDINSLIPINPNTDEEADVLGFASQKMPQTTNLQNVLKNNFENGLNLFKRIQTPKMLQDAFSSINSRLSEGFTSNTNNALKKFRNSLDVAREPFTLSKNNLLGKPLINSDHLFGAAMKTHEDFNDKLHAIHSDLNRRLSSISSGTSPDRFILLRPLDRLKNSKNRVELHNVSSKNTGTKSAKTKPTVIKNPLLSKNIPSLESNKKKSTDLTPRSNKADILRSNIKEKLGLLPHQKNLGYKKEPFAINPPKSLLTPKHPPKGNKKLKPLKDNKVTISFSTTSIRPDTLKSRFKPHHMDSLRSRSANGLSKMPKLSEIVEDKKKPNLNSKLKSNEPKSDASEISMSRATLPATKETSKLLEEVSSLEESDRWHGGNLQSYDDRRPAGLSEANKRKKFLPSILKNSFATRTTTDDGTNRNDKLLSSRQRDNALYATQSASDNIDTRIAASSLLEETSKHNNQSFKCKMVCIQDICDLTDSYKI